MRRLSRHLVSGLAALFITVAVMPAQASSWTASISDVMNLIYCVVGLSPCEGLAPASTVDITSDNPEICEAAGGTWASGVCGAAPGPTSNDDAVAAEAYAAGLADCTEATTPYDWSQCSDGSEGPTDAATLCDELFLNISGQPLHMDVRIPEGTDPFPAVVVVHGGAFFMGDKAEGNALQWAKTLPTEGYVSVSVNYRLTGDFPEGTSAFPGALQDIKCALRVLRTRADDYRIDPNRVFILGSSAGGYFASAIATTTNNPELDESCPAASSTDSSVLGAVSFFGPCDWRTIVAQRGSEGLDDPEASFVGDTCATASQPPPCTLGSANNYLDPTDPPMFLLHSNDDPTIPVAQSSQFMGELMALGVPVEYQEVTGLGHGWSGNFSNPQVDAARTAVIDWLGGL